jgi:hypothetical protein
MLEFDAAFVEGALRHFDIWNLGNKVLYELCADYPDHREDAAVFAKLWLIGRSYAAAIERRNKYLGLSTDDFYTQKVGPTFRAARIDDWLRELSKDHSADCSLRVHHNFCALTNKITGRYKRSLASKYLHFHFPSRFFIYDSQAFAAVQHVRQLLNRQRISKRTVDVDIQYAAFFDRCEDLRGYVHDCFRIELNPRELDNILRVWYASHIQNNSMTKMRPTKPHV